MATDSPIPAQHPRRLATLLAGLSPLGPLFAKELRVTARRKRTYVLRFAYLGVLLLVLLFVYAVNYWDNYGYTGVARRAQRLAEMGTYFFGAFSFFTMIAMALLGPILTSTAINAERLHKTLPVLLMTPITAWQIVAGKLFSRLLIAFTLIGLSLPVLALVRLLGGVEIPQMFASLLLCATVAVTSAAIGLFFSTVMSRAYAVILLAYGFMGVVYALLPMLLGIFLFAILRLRGNAGEAFMLQFMSWTNPGLAMVMVALNDRPPIRIGGYEQVVFTHLLFSTLLVVWTALILRRRARLEAEGGAPASPTAIVAPPPDPTPTPSPSPGTPEEGRGEGPAFRPHPSSLIPPPSSRPVSDNPVLWRETRRPLLAKRWQRWGISLFFLGTILFIYVAMAVDNAIGDPDAQVGFAFVFCAILNLLTCILAGSAIAQEKESDTWTLLLATPLSARRIVLGKFAGLLRKFLWPAALVVAHFALFTVGGVMPLSAFLLTLYLLFAFNLVWLATGLYFSLRLHTTTFAVIANLLLPLALYGGLALVLAIVGALFFRSPEWGEFPGLYMPYVYLIQALDELTRNGDYRNPSIWAPCFGRMPREEFFALVFFAGLVHLAATALVLWYTIAHFNRIVGRADQHAPLPTHPHHTPSLRPTATRP